MDKVNLVGGDLNTNENEREYQYEYEHNIALHTIAHIFNFCVFFPFMRLDESLATYIQLI